jgi:hypothetical protein
VLGCRMGIELYIRDWQDKHNFERQGVFVHTGKWQAMFIEAQTALSHNSPFVNHAQQTNTTLQLQQITANTHPTNERHVHIYNTSSRHLRLLFLHRSQ